MGSRRGRSEGAELEGENKRAEGLKPVCEGALLCGKKILLSRKFFGP